MSDLRLPKFEGDFLPRRIKDVDEIFKFLLSGFKNVDRNAARRLKSWMRVDTPFKIKPSKK